MKTEALLEDGRHAMSDNLSEASSAERDHARMAAAAALAVSSAPDDHNKPSTPSNSDHFLSAFHGNGLHQQEQEREHVARVEALQVIKIYLRKVAWHFMKKFRYI